MIDLQLLQAWKKRESHRQIATMITTSVWPWTTLSFGWCCQDEVTRNTSSLKLEIPCKNETFKHVIFPLKFEIAENKRVSQPFTSPFSQPKRPKFGVCRCYKDIPPMLVPNGAHRKDIPNIPLQPCHSVIFLSWKELALGLMVSNPSGNLMTHPLKYRWCYTNWKTFRCFGVAVTQTVSACVFFKKWIIYIYIY